MIVFFLNKFNDIDHASPIIYKLASEQDSQILIISINIFLDIENDFRIKYIKIKFPGIIVSNLMESIAPTMLAKLLNLIFNNKNKVNNKKYLKRLIRKIFFKFSIIKLLENIFYTKSRINGFLKKTNPSLIVIDHATTERLPGISHIFRYFQDNNIASLSVPHSFSLFVDHDDKVFRASTLDISVSPVSNIIFTNNNYRDECINVGLSKDKTHVLGSARFCEEWSKIL